MVLRLLAAIRHRACGLCDAAAHGEVERGVLRGGNPDERRPAGDPGAGGGGVTPTPAAGRASTPHAISRPAAECPHPAPGAATRRTTPKAAGSGEIDTAPPRAGSPPIA